MATRGSLFLVNLSGKQALVLGNRHQDFIQKVTRGSTWYHVVLPRFQHNEAWKRSSRSLYRIKKSLLIQKRWHEQTNKVIGEGLGKMNPWNNNNKVFPFQTQMAQIQTNHLFQISILIRWNWRNLRGKSTLPMHYWN